MVAKSIKRVCSSLGTCNLAGTIVYFAAYETRRFHVQQKVRNLLPARARESFFTCLSF
jgi:hypothetical protein